jgi:hypothetical protein
MEYADKEKYWDVLDSYFPCGGFLGVLEKAGIDWTLLDRELIDAIADVELSGASYGRRMAEARYLGKILALERKLKSR